MVTTSQQDLFHATDTKRRQLLEVLQTAGGNQRQAARMLGINRVTMWKRMQKYGIQLKREVRR